MGWDAPGTDILGDIQATIERDRTWARRVGKTYFPMSRAEYDDFIAAYPEREGWFKEHALVFDPLPEEPRTLLERLNDRHGKDEKEPAALNRADRRRLRKREAR